MHQSPSAEDRKEKIKHRAKLSFGGFAVVATIIGFSVDITPTVPESSADVVQFEKISGIGLDEKARSQKHSDIFNDVKDVQMQKCYDELAPSGTVAAKMDVVSECANRVGEYVSKLTESWAAQNSEKLQKLRQQGATHEIIVNILSDGASLHDVNWNIEIDEGRHRGHFNSTGSDGHNQIAFETERPINNVILCFSFDYSVKFAGGIVQIPASGRHREFFESAGDGVQNLKSTNIQREYDYFFTDPKCG